MRLVMLRLAVLAAFGLGASSLPAQVVPITLAPGEVLLQVQAEGEAWSKPDEMTVSAGVVTTGRTARDALSANSALANRLVEAVRANGVLPADVQTSELSVAPQFDERDSDRADREDRKPRITGYIARNRLQLRLRDLAKAPLIVDSLFGAGANEVRGPAFSIKDPRAPHAQARRAAVASALEEASAYAEAMNMRISRVLRVSQRGDFDMQAGNTIVVTGSRMLATPVEPGEIRTSVQVWIDYAMLPK